MEIKQHIPEQPIGQRKNQRGNKKCLKQIKIETQHTKTWNVANTVRRQAFIAIHTYIKEKKALK